MTEKPHVSPTQLEMHARCGMQHHFRYVQGIILQPGMALIRGRSVHTAAEMNHRQKVDTHEDISVAEMKEAAAAAFDEGTAGGYDLNSEERSRGDRVVVGEAKDRAVEATELYGKEIAPEYQPVLVERRFRIVLPGTHDLVGVVDMADDRRRVVDLKTSGKKKVQADVDASLQLTTYAIGHKAITGHDAAGLTLETVVQTKTRISRQTLHTSRTAASSDVLVRRINAMTKAIRLEVITPAPPSAWWCSRKWCGYWDRCEFVNNGSQLNE